MSDDLRAALEKIRERSEKATKGPWSLTTEEDHDDAVIWAGDDFLANVATRDGSNWVAFDVVEAASTKNGDFIAAARTDIPALIKACEILREALEEIAKPDPESAVHSVKERRLNANRKILAMAALSAAAEALEKEGR